MLPVYFAPLEGVTDAVYRCVHHAHFTGVSKYFIPFISPTQHLVLTSRDLSAIAPEQNAGIPAVPQVLTRNAEHFLWAACTLRDLGYTEVNLNCGCPSGTVTAKGKGAGMLLDLFALERFLDAVFARSPIRISVKTRIGFTDADEFDDLLSLFSRYPLGELIIHPRTRNAFYKGQADRAAYARAACAKLPFPLVYNGDLFTPSDCICLAADHPSTDALMIGRGLIANPALAQTLSGGAPLCIASLRAFHDDLLAAYLDRYPQHVVLGRMREIGKHIVCCFEDPAKPRKAIRKASSLAAYTQAMDALFALHPLCSQPGFDPLA